MDAEEARQMLTEQQQRQIRNMYLDLAKQIEHEAQYLPKDAAPDEIRNYNYLMNLQRQVMQQANVITEAIGETIMTNVQHVVNATVENANYINAQTGLNIQMSTVNNSIISRVMSGSLYESDWSLSESLWGANSKIHSDIYEVVARGMALNKSAYDIAKDLESYVNPDMRKDWEWSKVFPGTNLVVDYAAQRLARTMVSHAYQAAFVESTIHNPFVTMYRWRSAGIHGRTCELCFERDGQLFEKGELPLDHPNGLCTYIAVIKDLREVAKDLVAWHRAPQGTFKQIDEYAEWLRRN